MTPLIPSISLREIAYMPIETDRFLKSDSWILAKADPVIAYAMINLWLSAWHQVPAASVPSNDELLSHLAMVDADTWARIKTPVLAGWALCDDGRYYHPTVAEKALEADEARAKSAAFSELQSAKGRASAAARALKPSTTRKPALSVAVAAVASTVEGPAAVAIDPRQISLLDNEEIPAAKPAAAKKITDAEIVFEHWKMVMESPRSKFGDDRAKMINKWLKEYSVEDLMQAIDGCRSDPFSMGANKTNTIYNRLGLILRDKDHIDDFMSKANGAHKKLISPTSQLTDAAKQTFEMMRRRREARDPGGLT